MVNLTHINDKGDATMVDVTAKDITRRQARAAGSIFMEPETLALIESGGVKKGDVLSVARIAGIMAAKKTYELVPLCHPLALTGINMDFEFDQENSAVHIEAACKLKGRTGVEMEALAAVSVATLTIYDMCKAADRSMRITDIRVIHKSGGESGVFETE